MVGEDEPAPEQIRMLREGAENIERSFLLPMTFSASGPRASGSKGAMRGVLTRTMGFPLPQSSVLAGNLLQHGPSLRTLEEPREHLRERRISMPP